MRFDLVSLIFFLGTPPRRPSSSLRPRSPQGSVFPTNACPAIEERGVDPLQICDEDCG